MRYGSGDSSIAPSRPCVRGSGPIASISASLIPEVMKRAKRALAVGHAERRVARPAQLARRVHEPLEHRLDLALARHREHDVRQQRGRRGYRGRRSPVRRYAPAFRLEDEHGDPAGRRAARISGETGIGAQRLVQIRSRRSSSTSTARNAHFRAFDLDRALRVARAGCAATPDAWVGRSSSRSPPARRPSASPAAARCATAAARPGGGDHRHRERAEQAREHVACPSSRGTSPGPAGRACARTATSPARWRRSGAAARCAAFASAKSRAIVSAGAAMYSSRPWPTSRS